MTTTTPLTSEAVTPQPRPKRRRSRLAIILGLLLVAGCYFTWTVIDARRTDAVIGLLTSHGSVQVQRQPWHRNQAYYRTPLVRGVNGQFTRAAKPLWLDFIDRYVPQFLIPTRLVCNQFIIDDEDRAALRLLGKINARLNGVSTLYVRTSLPKDDEFSELRKLTQVQVLYLSGSSISDTSLQYISGLRQLKTLDLSDTSVTDAGLKHLRELTQMQFLDLSSTQVTDAGLESLMGMSKIKHLNLEGTNVTSAGIQKLRSRFPFPTPTIVVP